MEIKSWKRERNATVATTTSSARINVVIPELLASRINRGMLARPAVGDVVARNAGKITYFD